MLLGTLGAIVDGLGLGNFAGGPRENALWRGECEAESVPGVLRRESSWCKSHSRKLIAGSWRLVDRLWQIQWLHVERETANLVCKDCERRRRASVANRLALHYRVEGCRAALNIVRLDCEHFSQCVRSSVAEERPHFHLAKALSAVLCLASQGLLCDETVRTDASHVDLVLNHVMQL